MLYSFSTFLNSAISPGQSNLTDNMGTVTTRNRLTSRGFCALSPWNGSGYEYSVLQIKLGSNPLSKIEIVSLLNLSNNGFQMYHYNYVNCTKKYNPKVYLGAVQSVTTAWQVDLQNGSNRADKSGSKLINIFLL